jgi:hypothetical protein
MNDQRTLFEARLGRFGRVRRAVKNGALAYGTGVLALGVGIGALILLRGWTWSSSPFVNAGIDAIPTAAAALLLVWLLARLLRRWEWRRKTLSEAFRAEELEGDLNSRLVSAVDFLVRPVSTPLTDAVIEKAIQDLERPFEKRLDRSARNRARWQFAGALVVFVLLGLTPWFGFARVGNTVQLCVANLREFLLPTRFDVFPGSKVFLIGAKAEVGLQFTRFRYPSVLMLTENAEGRGMVTTNILTVTAAGRAAESLQPTVERQYRIRFAFGNRITAPMQLTFTTSPMIENMQVELVYPLYTRLMPKEIEGVVDRITALGGTRVNLGYVFNKALKSAVLTFEDGTNSMRMPLDVVGRFASISFVHSRESRASLQVEDSHGFKLGSPQPIEFSLTADNPPKLFPSAFLKQDMACTIEDLSGFTFGARVEDDFGASKCRVIWQQSTADDPREIPGEPIECVFLPPRPMAVASFENMFRAQAEALMEKGPQGNIFKFQIEAFDNHEPKPQKTVSSWFSIFIKQGMEVVGPVGSGTDISDGKRFNRGDPKTTRQFGDQTGPKGIGMPEKLDTAGRGNDFSADRPEVGVRGSRAGGTDSTQKAYGAGLIGPK